MTLVEIVSLKEFAISSAIITKDEGLCLALTPQSMLETQNLILFPFLDKLSDSYNVFLNEKQLLVGNGNDLSDNNIENEDEDDEYCFTTRFIDKKNNDDDEEIELTTFQNLDLENEETIQETQNQLFVGFIKFEFEYVLVRF